MTQAYIIIINIIIIHNCTGYLQLRTWSKSWF